MSTCWCLYADKVMDRLTPLANIQLLKGSRKKYVLRLLPLPVTPSYFSFQSLTVDSSNDTMTHRCSHTLLILNTLPLSQAAHTPRPCSRHPSPYFPVVTANSISTVPSRPACSAPAAASRRGAWTVVAVTVEVRWCVSVREEAGWFTGSHPGAMPAGQNSPLASTPKSLPSVPGYAR